MIEIWDLYDINKNKLGRNHERGIPLGTGEYHLVVEIWIINNINQILLTQRHPSKFWGNLWECTGGAVVAGEDSKDCSKRELNEEVGIEISKEQLSYLGTQRSKDWFTDSFLVKVDISINNLQLQADEVINAKWVGFDEFEDMCSKELIVPSTRERFYLYRDRLNLINR